MKCENGSPVRAWAICVHALAGAPIQEPVPPTEEPWVGSVVCRAKSAEKHSVDELKLTCEVCAIKQMPLFAEYIQRSGLR